MSLSSSRKERTPHGNRLNQHGASWCDTSCKVTALIWLTMSKNILNRPHLALKRPVRLYLFSANSKQILDVPPNRAVLLEPFPLSVRPLKASCYASPLTHSRTLPSTAGTNKLAGCSLDCNSCAGSGVTEGSAYCSWTLWHCRVWGSYHQPLSLDDHSATRATATYRVGSDHSIFWVRNY